MREEKPDYLKNYGMLIPHGATVIEELVEDPRGAPVYAKCPSEGLCACTGACLEIIDYTKDPVKLAAHREYISNINSFRKNSMQNLGNRKWDGYEEIFSSKK